MTYLPVDQYGRVNPDDVQQAITPATVLITIMHANNEVGTIQPVAELAALARARGIRVHTDAAQSLGKIPVDVRELGVDLLSLAGHKLYAPKGVGALFIRRGVTLETFMHGAGQEMVLRAGTENILEIVGLGKACEVAARDLEKNHRHLQALRDREADWPFVEKLKRTVLDAGYEDRVLFLGYRTDVIDLLSILDVFVHASVRPEPFGMVILEAMAAERPIVVTNVGGPVEILNSGECGILVPPGDGSAIAEACREYLENPSLARQKVRKATQRLNDCFHISRTRENIEQLFEHIVSRNKPQQRHHHRPEMISTTGRGIEI